MMMWLRTLLTQHLLAVAAWLAALLVASNLGWCAYSLIARASLHAAQEAERAAVTERDAWKNKTAELATANRAWQDVIARLRDELAAAQKESRRLDAESRKALAAARAQATNADAAHKQFDARYQAQRAVPECGAALAAVQQRCTGFEGY